MYCANVLSRLISRRGHGRAMICVKHDDFTVKVWAQLTDVSSEMRSLLPKQCSEARRHYQPPIHEPY